MPTETDPSSLEELTETLAECGSTRKSIELGGHFSKRAMGGVIASCDVVLSTSRMNRVLLYEPNDLTISVEAGITYQRLSAVLAENRQWLPLDPPYGQQATIGGIIAANSSGPRRRRYGTARDLVIGMKMVTMEGKVVASGGMVVKNVTGLDMAKLLVGSFGTLAAIGSVNFRVFPRPVSERTFLFSARELDSLLSIRKAVLESVLQPVALDLLSPSAAEMLGLGQPYGYLLMAEAAGSEVVIHRFAKAFEKLALENKVAAFQSASGSQADDLWTPVREFPAEVARRNAEGLMLRVGCEPKKLGEVFRLVRDTAGETPTLTRAANGVSYIACSILDEAARCLKACREAGLAAVVESAPEHQKMSIKLWDGSGTQFQVMERVKSQFDPWHLLNPGRLFNLI